MIKDSNKFLKLLSDNFGTYSGPKNNEVTFFCPFHYHRKRKMNINIANGHWHCFVCENGSKNIIDLFKKTQKSEHTINKVYDLIDNKKYVYSNLKAEKVDMSLPNEFISLSIERKSPEYQNALYYLNSRGITQELIDTYNIGYCEDGEYSQRIIIPSYDKEGNLNYFTARTYYDVIPKYKNPNSSREIVPFELYTTTLFPIILVEGFFDAIKIENNAIPLLGNLVNRATIGFLVENDIKEIYLALDSDGSSFIFKNIERLLNFDIRTKIVILPETKDPATMSPLEFQQCLENNVLDGNLKTIMKYKLRAK